MANPRRGAQDDRRLVAFRQVERLLHHGVALVGAGGIEYGDLREACEPACVLLGLARYGAGIVRHEHHEPAANADVVQAHERIACHVQPHLLAGEQRARARKRRAVQKLHGGLLVRGPFHMDALRHALRMQLRHGFDDFARRRARIARHHVHPGFECRIGERLVAHQQRLTHGSSPFRISAYSSLSPLQYVCRLAVCNRSSLLLLRPSGAACSDFARQSATVGSGRQAAGCRLPALRKSRSLIVYASRTHGTGRMRDASPADGNRACRP